MKLLLCEDDQTTLAFILKGLTEIGHIVETVSDGREALSHCLYSQYDVIILDRMLPGMDGLSVLKSLRATNNATPVIFLTAMADVEDRVEGLLAGGDDYLVKPFQFSELMARITALSRRPPTAEESHFLAVHDLQLDLLSRVATRAEQPISLLPKEFSLLELLMRNQSRIVTKTMILEQVWGFNFNPKTTVVETHISRLRSKIDKPFDVALLHTCRNSGYSIRAPH